MKKLRKVLAVVLAMAMVMGMSIMSFAAETDGTASITIKGLTANDNTVLKLYEIVTFNAKDSKWDVAEWAESYVNDETNPYGFDYEGLKTASDSVTPTDTKTNVNDSEVTFTGLKVGAYMIIASGDTTAYDIMVAPTYQYNDDKLIGPKPVTISAKGQGYTVTKKYTEDSLVKDFAKLGDKISFDIDTVFPSFADDTNNRTFTITDTPVGMKITEVEVYVNNQKIDQNGKYTVSELNKADTAVTVAFTKEYIGDKNAHAGQAVKVVVKAVVTNENSFTNKATSNINKDETPAEVTGDVGSITINKKDTAQNVLKGAKFEIKRNDEKTALSFVKVSDGVYTLKTDDVAGDAVTEVEATDGTVVLKGLGAGTYHITETVAPEGYSINSKIDDVVLSENDLNQDGTVDHDMSREVIDTKLSELPSTGGIGTTIFTIVGCLLMIGAASFLFVSRRRADR